ncbi:hypothetical protein SAMN05192545_2543 [Maribacter dokdonensis]|uniref:Uncharacterized protein n=1 Tax=Maribacter dokdonensis TaxID=320912 RepID=A0ABY0UPN1_9FLAO|nr:hypothetical protein [Maribacter dokdonensis]SDT00204.1 hypothetical protein SAMN05192545_2543 [Maribacter dokdonensis]
MEKIIQKLDSIEANLITKFKILQWVVSAALALVLVFLIILAYKG